MNKYKPKLNQPESAFFFIFLVYKLAQLKLVYLKGLELFFCIAHCFIEAGLKFSLVYKGLSDFLYWFVNEVIDGIFGNV